MQWNKIPDDGNIIDPGRYCLSGDMETGREIGVNIVADNVTLDLGGYTLKYRGHAKEGTFGINCASCHNVVIENGCIEGFWVGLQINEGERLTVQNITFPRICYIGLSVAEAKRVDVAYNHFNGFRDDLPRPGDKYIIGVNAGAQDMTIRGNRFDHPGAMFENRPDVEIVYVLLVGRQSLGAVVSHNEMQMERLLCKTYGVWAGLNSQSTIANNRITNVHHGIALQTGKTAVLHNKIAATSVMNSTRMETVGVMAGQDAYATVQGNHFLNIQYPVTMLESGGIVSDNRFICQPRDDGTPAGAYGVFRNNPKNLTLLENEMEGICVPVYDVETQV